MGLIFLIHLILFIYFIIIILKGNENSKVCKFKNTSSKTCNGIPHYQYSNKAHKSTIGNINSNRNTLLNQLWPFAVDNFIQWLHCIIQIKLMNYNTDLPGG